VSLLHKIMLENEQYIKQLKLQAKPTDFAELERKGIIKKDKGQWYIVPDFRALPDHAVAKIKKIEPATREVKQRVQFAKGIEFAATRLLKAARA
jgi:hypothetical protein